MHSRALTEKSFSNSYGGQFQVHVTFATIYKSNRYSAFKDTQNAVERLLELRSCTSGGSRLAQTFGAFALKLAGRDENEATTYLEYGNHLADILNQCKLFH